MALNSWLRRLKPLDIRSRICMIRYYPSTLLHSGTLWCDPRTILSSKRGIYFSRYYLRDMKTYDLQTQEVAKAFGAVCTPEFYLYKKVICFAISWHEFSWIYCNCLEEKVISLQQLELIALSKAYGILKPLKHWDTDCHALGENAELVICYSIVTWRASLDESVIRLDLL